MTWTTIGPNGATSSIGAALITLSVLTLVYTLGLLYRLAQLRRMEGLRIPAEGLDEDQEEDEET
ncbi:MAG: hypothetical protein ABIJ47_01315 [Candidatus Bathyarchaeota archaeon]